MTRHTRRLLVRGALSEEQVTNAPLTKHELTGERTPRPSTWFSLRHRLRGFASARGAVADGGRIGDENTMHATTTNDRTVSENKSRVLQGGCSGGLCPREAHLYTPPERPHEDQFSYLQTCYSGSGFEFSLARSPPRNDPPVRDSRGRGVLST